MNKKDIALFDIKNKVNLIHIFANHIEKEQLKKQIMTISKEIITIIEDEAKRPFQERKKRNEAIKRVMTKIGKSTVNFFTWLFSSSDKKE